MEFIWRTLIVLALTIGVANASFLDAFSSYRTQIRMRLGFATTSTALTDTLLNTCLRQAVVQVNNEVGGYRVVRTILTAPSTYSYPLDSTIAPENVSVRMPGQVLKPLRFRERSGWDSVLHTATVGQKDPLLQRPSYYDFTDTRLFVYPPPYLVDTLEIVGIQRVQGLDTLSTLTQIPERYRTLIFLYATQLVAQSRQHPMFIVIAQEYEAAKQKIMGASDAAKATGVK